MQGELKAQNSTLYPCPFYLTLCFHFITRTSSLALLFMPDCPKCHQFVDSQAIACPHCRTPLKAYGHPGMKLFQATKGEPLCASCVYHADDSCNFPKRPYAMDCTLYQNTQPSSVVASRYDANFRLKGWVKRNMSLLLLVGLLLLSLSLVLVRR